MYYLMQGETETSCINRRIKEAAAPTDKQFLEHELRVWRSSKHRRDQIAAERYYTGRHDILKHIRTAIGPGGQLQEMKNLPNRRIVDNQYAKMVDQKVNYLLGKPLSFETQNKAYAAVLGRVFNNRFYRTFRNLGEDSLNGGLGWLYVHLDEAGELCFKRFESYEILPFWSDAEHTALDAALRLFEVERYENGQHRIVEHAELYVPNGVYRFLVSEGGALRKDSPAFQPYTLSTDDTPLGWTRVPLIPFKYTNSEAPLLNRVKSLQDGINLMLSTFQNNMEEDARNSILVLVNYEGEDLGEFRRNLSVYGAVKVANTKDYPGGDVRTLMVEVNADNYKAILQVFKKALIENARGYDAKDDRLSGNPNQMNIQSMYSDIDLDANGMETEYQASMEELLWFVNAYLYDTGQGDFAGEQVRVIFNRDILINESQAIEDCAKSVGIISNETITGQHPWVKVVDEELRRIKKEKQAAVDDYANAFAGQYSEGG